MVAMVSSTVAIHWDKISNNKKKNIDFLLAMLFHILHNLEVLFGDFTLKNL